MLLRLLLLLILLLSLVMVLIHFGIKCGITKCTVLMMMMQLGLLLGVRSMTEILGVVLLDDGDT